MVTQILELVTVVLNSFGVIALSALGLAIIFGMMGIINLAHGEFMMIGAFTTTLTYHRGVPLALAIALGSLAAGVVGIAAERIVIKHLYDREIESMVATWGISLILSQSVLILFGSHLPGIGIPFGTLTYQDYSASMYNLVLAVVAGILLVVIYAIFRHTKFGLHARATIQRNETARALGVDTPKMYFMTFFIGSALAGLAGGLIAPTIAIVPTLGTAFIIDAFTAVIVGGANVLIGVPAAAGALGILNGVVSQWGGTMAGRVALLLTAMFILRVAPTGISGYLTETGE